MYRLKGYSIFEEGEQVKSWRDLKLHKREGNIHGQIAMIAVLHILPAGMHRTSDYGSVEQYTYAETFTPSRDTIGWEEWLNLFKGCAMRAFNRRLGQNVVRMTASMIRSENEVGASGGLTGSDMVFTRHDPDFKTEIPAQFFYPGEETFTEFGFDVVGDNSYFDYDFGHAPSNFHDRGFDA